MSDETKNGHELTYFGSGGFAECSRCGKKGVFFVLQQCVPNTARVMLRKIEGPLESAKELTDLSMGSHKDRDDCTPDEIRARGIWHALHYIERYLTDWESPAHTDWEATTKDFIKMSLTRPETPTPRTETEWSLEIGDVQIDHLDPDPEIRARWREAGHKVYKRTRTTYADFVTDWELTDE